MHDRYPPAHGSGTVTGSTRLKAGTATKMALNVISTSVMVRLGKVYGNRMVMYATNSKRWTVRGSCVTSLMSPEQGTLTASIGGVGEVGPAHGSC